MSIETFFQHLTSHVTSDLNVLTDAYAKFDNLAGVMLGLASVAAIADPAIAPLVATATAARAAAEAAATVTPALVTDLIVAVTNLGTAAAPSIKIVLNAAAAAKVAAKAV